MFLFELLHEFLCKEILMQAKVTYFSLVESFLMLKTQGMTSANQEMLLAERILAVYEATLIEQQSLIA